MEVVAQTRTDATNQNLYNIARIFKVYQFQRITDMYGDCPYTQAGQVFLSGITAPVYVNQEIFYVSLLSELYDAATNLSTSGSTPGSADIVYGGDVTKWKKFAFSEMVRVAMRMSKVDPTNAQKWVQTAVAGGVFASNADNAIIQHQAVAVNGAGSQVGNGSGGVFITNDPTAAHLSNTFVNFLSSTGDPRLPYLGTIIADATVPTDKGDTATADQLGPAQRV